jgi:hypothetical protein
MVYSLSRQKGGAQFGTSRGVTVEDKVTGTGDLVTDAEYRRAFRHRRPAEDVIAPPALTAMAAAIMKGGICFMDRPFI